MPVIVDEVVISVDVNNPASPGDNQITTENKQDIVAQCVERVLEILEQQQER
jgi:hypothetical protein